MTQQTPLQEMAKFIEQAHKLTRALKLTAEDHAYLEKGFGSLMGLVKETEATNRRAQEIVQGELND